MALAAKQKDKVRRWIRVIMVFVAALLLLFAAAIPIVNNAIALGVEKDLKNLPLPEKTELIETTSKAGKFVGSGNGMQYFGAILVKSDLPYDTLQAYYEQHDCIVKAQLSDEIEWANSNAPSFRHKDYDGPYFIVYRWGSAPSWVRDLLDTDLRGH
jgi:hypothetical protein